MTHKFTHPDDAEPGHEWVTADGREARIDHTDGGMDWPLLGGVKDPETGFWRLRQWHIDGKAMHHESSIQDALKRGTKTGWVNIYATSNDVMYYHKSRNKADTHASDNRIACIKLEFDWVEGQSDE